MSKIPVGTRVAALKYSNDMLSAPGLIGYGVYDGDFVIPAECAMLTSSPNSPRITLDDGSIVWGFECWWGPEQVAKQRFNLNSSDAKVVYIDHLRLRAEAILSYKAKDPAQKQEAPEPKARKFKEHAPSTGLSDYLIAALPACKLVYSRFYA